jgi:hypothetical protein
LAAERRTTAPRTLTAIALATLALEALALASLATAPAGALRYEGSGRGIPVAEYPSPQRIASAARFINARTGHTAFAVVDTRGQLAGVRIHDRFHSASTVKAMLLTAYLQNLAGARRGLDSSSRALLYPMIHVSDNSAASAVFGLVGESGLSRVAREVGMTDFSPSSAWGFTMISAADQARFFYVQDRLIPRQFDGYARGLLSGIDPSQSSGIPAGARPEFQVFFKGGWLPSEGLVNQSARLERPGITFALSVLTTNGPGMAYGEATLEGVTRRLVGKG